MQKSYSLQGPLGGVGWLLVVLSFLITVILGIVVLASRADLWIMGIIFLLTLPFWSLGLYMGIRHSGELILTDDAIILRRFGREQRLAYQEIIGSQELDNNFPPNFTLKAEGRALKFTRQMPKFVEVYAWLCEHVPALKYAGPKGFPVEMYAGKDILFNLGGGWLLFGIFALIFLGVGLSRPGNDPSAVIVFCLILFLVGGGACSLVYWGAPWRLRLQEDSIEVWPLFSSYRRIRLEEITRISYQQVVVRVRGAQGLRSDVVIEVQGGKHLLLMEDHIKGLGQSPESLWRMLIELYRGKGVNFASE